MRSRIPIDGLDCGKTIGAGLPDHSDSLQPLSSLNLMGLDSLSGLSTMKKFEALKSLPSFSLV
jgi:hypothetical protein